jgi:DNA polymerase-3 subunit chi
MTQLVFHVNVTDPLGYACRLLRKAYRVGARVAVWGDARDIRSLDRLLWTFEPTEFVPHSIVASDRSAGAHDAPGREAPIWLLEDLHSIPPAPCSVLNLSAQIVERPERFERVIEVVSDDEAALQAARQRWKHYAALGLAPEKHEVNE